MERLYLTGLRFRLDSKVNRLVQAKIMGSTWDEIELKANYFELRIRMKSDYDLWIEEKIQSF